MLNEEGIQSRTQHNCMAQTEEEREYVTCVTMHVHGEHGFHPINHAKTNKPSQHDQQSSEHIAWQLWSCKRESQLHQLRPPPWQKSWN